MYGEDEVPMTVQLPAQIHAPSSNSTTPTPVNMVNTPIPTLPQMPGSSTHTPWSFHQSQSQELTPIMQVMNVNEGQAEMGGIKRSRSEEEQEGESEIDKASDSGDDE
jgi:hypothetical protein